MRTGLPSRVMWVCWKRCVVVTITGKSFEVEKAGVPATAILRGTRTL